MGQFLAEAPVAMSSRLFALIGHCRSRLVRMVAEIRERAALRAEFARLKQTGELDRVLCDIGVEPAEVSTLIENHPGAPRRLAAMMRHLQIEPTPQGLASTDMRAIQRTCLLCAVSGHCDRWADSDGLEDPGHFCPNAEAFRDLVASGKATYPREA